MPSRAARLWVALLIAALAAAQPPTPSLRHQRLAEFGKLWAAVKYFHPWLAYRDVDWDGALLAALPKAAEATGPADYARAVQGMLDALGDPATRVVPADVATPAAPSELLRASSDGTLIVTINPATVDDRARVLLNSGVARAAAVVFDLRHQEAWSGADAARTGLLFVSSGLNSQLAFGALKAPGHRSRIHSGLAAPWNGGSVYYHSAFYVRDGARIDGRTGGLEKPVVFLVDRSSNLPPIAVALQNAGKAKIVTAGAVSDASLVDRNLISLPDGVRVELRTTELVYEDGTTGLVPDLAVPEGADPLAAALKLARDPGRTTGVRRPALAAYGVPRREDAYSLPEFPDWQHRVLAVFRIWAAFEYFHAYRSLMDDDWNRVLVESLAQVEQAADAREYALAITRMLAHTDDSHVALSGSRAFNEFLGTARPGVETRIVEGLPVVTYAADGSGLSPGDVIVSVDGEPAAQRIARLKPYFAASTRQSLDLAVQRVWLNGPRGSEAALEIRDGKGSVRRVTLPRTESGPGPQRGGAAVQVIAGNAGYVDLERLAPGEVDAMFEKLKDTRAIVFDMRGYPQGTAWFIAPRLTERERVVAARFRRPLAMAPPGLAGDVSTIGASWDFVQHLPESKKWKYLRPTVMLIDERAMSQAEHLGLFLEAANGTKFVGSATAGANGDLSYFTVPGGLSISFSGQDIRHADGRVLQRVGLTPDVAVKPTIEGIRTGRDEVLEKALESLGVPSTALKGVGEAR